LVQGLYLTGEVLDVDGYTGGYNLQIAFTTGRIAGESVSSAAG
jgi:predicted flavoprotein YhiN